jgi:hypothetical protein
MSVPEKIKVNPHVFCYSPDLMDASNKLAEYLNCKVSKVYEDHFDLQAETANVAWLAGHGSKNNTVVGNYDGDFGYKIRSICDWLDTGGRNYEYLVDTCCYPNRRKNSQTFNNKYYCTNDNQCVMVITGYDSFNAWWNDSNMHAV